MLRPSQRCILLALVLLLPLMSVVPRVPLAAAHEIPLKPGTTDGSPTLDFSRATDPLSSLNLSREAAFDQLHSRAEQLPHTGVSTRPAPDQVNNATPRVQTSLPAEPTISPRAVDHSQSPLSFVPNRGQTDAAVRFLTHALGGTVFFTTKEIVLSLPGDTPTGSSPTTREASTASPQPTARPGHERARTTEPPVVVRLQFQDTNAQPVVQGVNQLPGKVSYLLGRDSQNWETNIPTYADVTYQALYPGIESSLRWADRRAQRHLYCRATR